jgi:hypothetical protein
MGIRIRGVLTNPYERIIGLPCGWRVLWAFLGPKMGFFYFFNYFSFTFTKQLIEKKWINKECFQQYSCLKRHYFFNVMMIVVYHDWIKIKQIKQ